ncbi:hypothetical protein PENTCL1PPCAC_6236 [Pristionchus entomophagus]|uniref:Uncharacterized protein n=1 Tax=Pristionchus entomophagus TaxID=358040 RepID=A0AAV5SVG6_9BILA|nr:hypothetical protein PENTCL1PPCAC_6236 [Pristionchus entomophagus]
MHPVRVTLFGHRSIQYRSGLIIRLYQHSRLHLKKLDYSVSDNWFGEVDHSLNGENISDGSFLLVSGGTPKLVRMIWRSLIPS